MQHPANISACSQISPFNCNGNSRTASLRAERKIPIYVDTKGKGNGAKSRWPDVCLRFTGVRPFAQPLSVA